MHNFKRDILHILQNFYVLFLPSFLLSHAKKPSAAGTKSPLRQNVTGGPGTQKKKRSNEFCCEIVGPLGPSGENRTHGLLNPIVLELWTQCTRQRPMYAVSQNFTVILPFYLVWCQDVSFLLWSNCGQPPLTNDFFPPSQVTSRNFDFSKSRLRFFVCTNYS